MEKEFLKDVVLFLSISELSNKKIENAMNLVVEKNISSFKDLIDDENFYCLLSTNEYKNILKFDDRTFRSLKDNLSKDNIMIVTKYDEDYPSSLFDLPDSPSLLFAKGDMSILDGKCISVVGSRMPSNYGKYITENNENYDEVQYLLEDSEYFVLGDNYAHSIDSRNFGVVEAEQIIGKVIGNKTKN